MPNIKSAKKRVKIIAKKTIRNKAANSELKTVIKKASAAIETSAADKEVVLKTAIKTIDKAAAKGLLHKNTAANKKSSLQKACNRA